MSNFSLVRGRSALVTWLVVAVVLILTSIPYWVATGAGGEDYVFAGVLMNPIDGQTYLAKMRQGWEGAWRYTLPFTAEPGQGAYIFLYYLGLGHLARITDISLEMIFQLARLFGAGLMLVALSRFYWLWLPTMNTARFAYILAAFGTGMGWILLPFDTFTSDFWVAEAYPILSAYSNPHFPLTIGLLALLLSPALRLRLFGVGALLLAVLLALISPFAVLICVGVLGVYSVYMYIQSRKIEWPIYRLVWVLLGGGAVLAYTYFSVVSDPVLVGWNSQNQTPSPPVWDFLLSFSPAIIAGALGVWAIFKRKTAASVLLLIWGLLVIGLIYLPIDLQRRLLVGFYVPIAGLAALGLSQVDASRPRRKMLFSALVFVLSLPTTILVLLAGLHGGQTNEPTLFLTRDEAAGLAWIDENAPAKALVLAGREIGLFLPGRTGRRVIYGHPFETVNSEAEEARLEAFFSDALSVEDSIIFLEDRAVDFIFFGPREQALGGNSALERYELVFSSGEVIIYRVEHEPGS